MPPLKPTTGNLSSNLAQYEEYMADRQMFTAGELVVMTADYQRPLMRSRVLKIANNWDINLWDAPVVNIHPLTGKKTLAEGQHRVSAAEIVLGDDAMIECRITRVTDPGRLFAAINTSKLRVSRLEIFRAFVDAGDTDAVGLDRMIRSHGLVPGHGVQPNLVTAIKGAETMYRMDRIALDQAFTVITKIMKKRGNNEYGWTNGNVVNAIWWFIRMTDCDLSSLVDKLARLLPYDAVRYNVNALTANLDHLAEIYNKSRRNEDLRVDPRNSPLWPRKQ
jgi:hypothetical protein